LLYAKQISLGCVYQVIKLEDIHFKVMHTTLNVNINTWPVSKRINPTLHKYTDLSHLSEVNEQLYLVIKR